MSTHRTARGKTFDMQTFRTKNEQVRTVGNVPANARGDLIDANGQVIKTRNQRTSDNYDRSIGTRGAKNQNPSRQAPNQTTTQAPVSDLSAEEQQLFEEFDQSVEQVEVAKSAVETVKSKKTPPADKSVEAD
jgi:hypothetical protein